MLKWILFALCIVGIYFFFFKKPKTIHEKKEHKKDSIMLECATCGTYVSSDEAIIQDGKYYCSKECAQC
ncbi:PP0621 family protein [Helicobacter turcicus]|uniref:Metallothionein n=1 Tax=Helicobacter turcicus TaxID=2867412 RepID=A0ABS7JNF9_9HELI|nr:PP0621 family protein [Helicobacter turcicus]MBX7490913.1 metallothionein [Helicobacter turcicus]MBX7545767.1 metallothionein [Helicobacter turcicus]